VNLVRAADLNEAGGVRTEPATIREEEMQKGFGVQVRVRNVDGGAAVAQPLAVAAQDESEAALVAAAAFGESAEAEVLRELSAEEVRSYGLDLALRGDIKALPALNF
jgi:hypothetical protein